MKPLDGGAEEIARALGGHRSGRGWSCRCPAHEDRAPSLSLADGADGRLLVRCFAGCSFEDIRRRCAGSGCSRGARLAAPARPGRDGAAAGCRGGRSREAAAAGGGMLGRDGADRRHAGRGDTCALAASAARCQRACGFTPICWHKSAKRLPALVAGVQGVDGRGLGVQRTYLAEPGRKADVEPPKASLGPVGGGAVRLCHGPGALLVCEGVETGLALVDALAADRGVRCGRRWARPAWPGSSCRQAAASW